VTYDLISELCAETNCENPGGALPSDFGRGLVKRSKGIFTVRKDNHATLKKIENCLRSGGAVILNFLYDEHNVRIGHFALLVGISQTGKTFYGVNYFSSETFSIIRRHTVRKDCRLRKFDGATDYPTVWYLQLK
jgi:hypothetical protein